MAWRAQRGTSPRTWLATARASSPGGLAADEDEGLAGAVDLWQLLEGSDSLKFLGRVSIAAAVITAENGGAAQ